MDWFNRQEIGLKATNDEGIQYLPMSSAVGYNIRATDDNGLQALRHTRYRISCTDNNGVQYVNLFR